jgi:alkanesulfonate monooxygenase SsuD/methylene tetrahydromethanopterin reductase-like flavin-dependent oxidoreductase (luciferase family)
MARKYIGGYWESVMKHYEFKADHFKNVKGYEYYGKMSDKIFKYGDDTVLEFFLNLQVWGTPEQCYERILKTHSMIGNDAFVGVFSYAGMPYEEAERSMRLFAREVMPELKAFQPQKLPAWAAQAQVA